MKGYVVLKLQALQQSDLVTVQQLKVQLVQPQHVPVFLGVQHGSIQKNQFIEGFLSCVEILYSPIDALHLQVQLFSVGDDAILRNYGLRLFQVYQLVWLVVDDFDLLIVRFVNRFSAFGFYLTRIFHFRPI